MGFSLPLHLKRTQTSYKLAITTIFVLPILTIGGYFIINRYVFKNTRGIADWYRFSAQTGLVSYMLAL